MVKKMALKKTEKRGTTEAPEINPVREMEFVRPDYCTEKTIDCKSCNKARTADDFEECKWYYDSVHSDGLCDCTGKMIERHYHIKYTAVERSTGNTIGFQNKDDRDNYIKHENKDETLILDIKILLSLFDDSPSDKTKKDIFKTFKILMENNSRIEEYSDILNSRDDIILMERIRGAIGEIENPEQTTGKTGKPTGSYWTVPDEEKKIILSTLSEKGIIKCSGEGKPVVTMKNALYLQKALHELKMIDEGLIWYTLEGKETWEYSFIRSEFTRDIKKDRVKKTDNFEYQNKLPQGKRYYFNNSPIDTDHLKDIKETIESALTTK